MTPVGAEVPGVEPDHVLSFSRAVAGHLVSLTDKHGAGAAVVAATGALARFAITFPAGPQEGWADLGQFLDDWEMHKIEQHEAERDDPEDW
jgi:hypothetical protein